MFDKHLCTLMDAYNHGKILEREKKDVD